jgi:hypothetical protein
MHSWSKGTDFQCVAWFEHRQLLLMAGIAALPLRMLLFADDENQQALSTLICSQPGLLLPAHEAALRCLATSRNDVIATNAAITAAAVAGAPTAAAGFLKRVFGSDLGQQQHQVQLYALQVTCVKCGLAAASKGGRVYERAAAQALGNVVITSSKVLMHTMTQCASSSGGSADGSSSSGSSCNTAAATALQQVAGPWVALLARCLHALAGMMEVGVLVSQPETAPELDRQSWQDLQLQVLPCMVVLTDHLGRAGLPPDQQQQLQEQHAAAMMQLNQLQVAYAAAGPAFGMQRLSSVAQQLLSLAQAVAGHIPVRSACNNPSCVNLQQRSELVLVGGKGCVCGRCKAAR